MAEHTKGPLRLNAGDSLKVMDSENRVAFTAQCGGMTGISLADAESNAETMVARWNALEGYNPDAVRDVVEALRLLLPVNVANNSYIDDDVMIPVDIPMSELRVALAALARLGGAS